MEVLEDVADEAVESKVLELDVDVESEEGEDLLELEEDIELVDLEDPGVDVNVEDSAEVVDHPVDMPGMAHLMRSRPATCPLDLPIAVTRRILKSASTKRITPDLLSACARAGGVFALYLLSASQDAATDSGRSTIRPLEIIEGLVSCGFPEIAEEVRVSMNIDVRKKKKKN